MLSEWDEDVFTFFAGVISTPNVANSTSIPSFPLFLSVSKLACMISNIIQYEDLIRLLFRTYGWPHNFNHTSFDSVYSRWREFLAIKNRASASASDITNQKLNLDSVTESLKFHSRRLRMECGIVILIKNPER